MRDYIILINQQSRIPKYRQIVDCIISDISLGILEPGQKIPSINELSETSYLSRDTVEKAYKKLRELHVITSVKGKGYYTFQTGQQSKKILFLFNKASTYKMIVYDSLVQTLGISADVDMYIYHCDESLFLNALNRGLNHYDHFVVMPHFKDQNSNHVSFTENVLKVLNIIPQEKLLILDNQKLDLKGKYKLIYQDFILDIYNALFEGLEKIKKYDKIILVYPSKAAYPYPKRILHGFEKFCNDQNLDYEILDEIYDDMELQKDVYITIQERDLVNLVQQIRESDLIMGTDIGIISYNETPLKALLGITVISTDFKAMGEAAANLILNNDGKIIKNPFNYIERNSL